MSKIRRASGWFAEHAIKKNTEGCWRPRSFETA